MAKSKDLVSLPKAKKARPAVQAPAPPGATAAAGLATDAHAQVGPTETDLARILPALRPHAIRAADLVSDPVNVKKHPEKQLEQLKGSLAVFGQMSPIIFNARTRVVEKGNGTLAAALLLGWEWVAALPAEHTEAQAASYAIADNRSAELSKWDDEALKARLGDVFTGTGEGKEQLEAMFADLTKQQKLWEEDQAGGQAQQKFEVVVECQGEEQQKSVYEELRAAGHECRLITF
jgi:hypothetical protein